MSSLWQEETKKQIFIRIIYLKHQYYKSSWVFPVIACLISTATKPTLLDNLTDFKVLNVYYNDKSSSKG